MVVWWAVVGAFLYLATSTASLSAVVCISSCPYVRCGALGLALGREKSLLLLATTTPAGAVFLLGGIAKALLLFPTSSAGGNPRSRPDRAAAASQCRSLLDGVAL
jgi:hypothetical protein